MLRIGSSAAHLAADLHSNAEVFRGAAVERQEGARALSIVAKPSCQGPCERPSLGAVGGEKGAVLRCSPACWVVTAVLSVLRTAWRWKAPRVGERLASSRRWGAARPSRDVHRASVRRAGGSVVLPRRSGQGEERSSRQEVPGAIEDGAKSLPGAIPVGSAEVRCTSAPVLEERWRLPDREATLDSAWQSSQRRFPVVRDVRSGPWSCSWKHRLQKSCERTRP